MILKSIGIPSFELPPFSKVGVTIIFAVIDSCKLFVATKSKFPVPSAAKPISILSFVHEYVIVPPVILEVNSIKRFSSLQTN